MRSGPWPLLLAWLLVFAGTTDMSDLTHSIATTRDELTSAFHLVHEAYVRSGLILPNPYSMRITPHHLLPSTDVLISSIRGEAFCTLTLIRDGMLGLPMEAVYAEEVELRRDAGLRISEASCLADRRHSGVARTLPALRQIMALTAQCAKHQGMNQILIAVHPHHAGFYRRLLGFQSFGATKPYEAVRNHPAVALSLDLDLLPVTNPQAYKRLFGERFPMADLESQPLPDALHEEFARIVYETYEADTTGDGGWSAPDRSGDFRTA